MTRAADPPSLCGRFLSDLKRSVERGLDVTEVVSPSSFGTDIPA